MNKFKLLLLFLLPIALFSPLAVADNLDDIKARQSPISVNEARQLPPFCLNQLQLQPEAQYLRKDMPVPGYATPHFCGGMKAMLRGFYDLAINEFDYVENHSVPGGGNVLLPSTCLYKAEALGKLGRTGEAIQKYTKAIQLNNKYKQAYAKFADFYVKIGMPNEALDIINTGLKYSPNSIALKRRLAKLKPSK